MHNEPMHLRTARIVQDRAVSEAIADSAIRRAVTRDRAPARGRLRWVPRLAGSAA